MKEIAKDVYFVGVDDREIQLFEGMYKVPCGVTYNSYVIKDVNIAVMDSVDARFGAEWLANIERVTQGRAPDYLIVQHMEPDHSACVAAFAKKYPQAKIVGNVKTLVMLEEYFGEGFPHNRLTVTDGDELTLGKHTLRFVFAPMVHWPEVMFSYDKTNSLLFSADAFGKFGASDTFEGDWTEEARRYYIGIVGKFGVQVRSAISKLAGLKIDTVAPLHGPVLSDGRLGEALKLYSVWSGYQPETEGTLVAHASVYGHTAEAAELLAAELRGRGEKVKVIDLARDDWAECVAQAFRFSKLVVAATTYNGGIFPAAREFINRLAERNYKKRTVAFMENGTWAPVCAKLMRAEFEKCAEISFAQTQVKIRSALSAESRRAVKELAEELVTVK